MIIITQDKVENRTISQTLGLVSGQSIRARHVGKDILAEMPKSPDIILNNKFDESINILSISLLKKIKEIVKN